MKATQNVKLGRKCTRKDGEDTRTHTHTHTHTHIHTHTHMHTPTNKQTPISL